MAETARPEERSVPRTWNTRGLIELVAIIVTPGALVTALLFYFGWIRTRSLYLFFGVEPALLNFQSVDYLLRSSEILFRPIIIGILSTFAIAFLGPSWPSA
jgi:hypothetical protein